MNVKKLIFPFLNRNMSLKNYWWHRLLIVVFFILLIATPIFVFWELNDNETKSRDNCLALYTGYSATINYSQRFEEVTRQQMQLTKDKSSYDTNSYSDERNRLQKEWDNIYKEINEGVKNCYASNPIHTKLNIGLALFSAILLGYLLQIIYYKVFLYIALGSNNKK